MTAVSNDDGLNRHFGAASTVHICVESHTWHMAARSEPLMLYSTKRICAAIWTAVLLALLQYSETASELISHVLSLLSFKRVMLSHAARVRRWHGCVCAPTTVAPRARHVFHPGW